MKQCYGSALAAKRKTTSQCILIILEGQSLQGRFLLSVRLSVSLRAFTCWHQFDHSSFSPLFLLILRYTAAPTSAARPAIKMRKVVSSLTLPSDRIARTDSTPEQKALLDL